MRINGSIITVGTYHSGNYGSERPSAGHFVKNSLLESAVVAQVGTAGSLALTVHEDIEWNSVYVELLAQDSNLVSVHAI